jgi:hypothetical protein
MMIIVNNDFAGHVGNVGRVRIHKVIEATYSDGEFSNFTQSVKSVCSVSK